MGSEKYPEENECEAFLTKHGGYSNASTDCEMVSCVCACVRVCVCVCVHVCVNHTQHNGWWFVLYLMVHSGK